MKGEIKKRMKEEEIGEVEISEVEIDHTKKKVYINN